MEYQSVKQPLLLLLLLLCMNNNHSLVLYCFPQFNATLLFPLQYLVIRSTECFYHLDNSRMSETDSFLICRNHPNHKTFQQCSKACEITSMKLSCYTLTHLLCAPSFIPSLHVC